MNKWEKECWRKTESEIEQIKSTNMIIRDMRDGIKFIPFKDLSLIKKIL